MFQIFVFQKPLFFADLNQKNTGAKACVLAKRGNPEIKRHPTAEITNTAGTKKQQNFRSELSDAVDFGIDGFRVKFLLRFQLFLRQAPARSVQLLSSLPLQSYNVQAGLFPPVTAK